MRNLILLGSILILSGCGDDSLDLRFVGPANSFTQTERKAFGAAIAKFQNTRFKLAEIKTQTEVNKAYIRQCSDKYQRGELTAVEASMAKLSSTELQCKVADECLQLFGGYGYMMEYGISRAYMDARIQRIYGGTSEIMKEIIARDVVGR